MHYNVLVDTDVHKQMYVCVYKIFILFFYRLRFRRKNLKWYLVKINAHWKPNSYVFNGFSQRSFGSFGSFDPRAEVKGSLFVVCNPLHY